MNTPSALFPEVHLKTTRVRFANVLVAVDLSASSANTIKIASDFAYQNGSRLIVAHIVEHSTADTRETIPEIQAKISLWVKPYLRNESRWAIAVGEGDVRHEISELIKKHCADLLIIGTHAATTVERLVLGSKAEELFRSIHIPVLTVGPHARSCGGFSSILFATDLEPGSLRAAQYAVSLAEESNATLTALHVLPEGEKPGAHKRAGLRMQLLVPEDAALWCDPVFRTESGDPAEAILAVAEQTGADLIVLAVTHASPLADHAHWSVASKVVRSAGCPVLTVRDHL